MDTEKKIREQLTFVIISIGLGMWGLASAMMRPTAHSISRVLSIGDAMDYEGRLYAILYIVYFALSIPAALTIRRYGFKSGLVVGLTLFGAGTMSFIPGSQLDSFEPFVVSYGVISAGILMIETSATPYLLVFGPRRESMYRLLIGQMLNVVGWVTGYVIERLYMTNTITDKDITARQMMDKITYAIMQRHDLLTVTSPYLRIGLIALLLAVVIAVTGFMDRAQDENPNDAGLRTIFSRLARDKVYLLGSLCQFGYVMAQTLTWASMMTFGSQFIMNSSAGITRAEASSTAVQFVMTGVVIFGVVRFVCAILAYKQRIRPARLLAVACAVAGAISLVSVFLDGYACMIGMLGISACMSIMYPTIYYLSMRRQDISGIQIGTVLQVLSIFGAISATYIMPSENYEFLIELTTAIVFGLIAIFGVWCHKNDIGAK